MASPIVVASKFMGFINMSSYFNCRDCFIVQFKSFSAMPSCDQFTSFSSRWKFELVNKKLYHCPVFTIILAQKSWNFSELIEWVLAGVSKFIRGHSHCSVIKEAAQLYVRGPPGQKGVGALDTCQLLHYFCTLHFTSVH